MKTQILTGLLSFAFAFTLHAVAPLISDVPDQNIAQSTNTLRFLGRAEFDEDVLFHYDFTEFLRSEFRQFRTGHYTLCL